MDTQLLITGAGGQLGLALQAKYPKARIASHKDLDISDIKAIQNFDWGGIATIVNAAGYTNVDGAESPDGRVAAWNVNAVGASNLARVCLQKDITLVHISTDYVFDGTKNPHKEDEPLSPLSTYGASKAAGDIAAGLAPKHYLLRTSWVIGEGKNFVGTMVELGKKGVNPSVVADQVGRPTFTTELALAIDHLLASDTEFGTYNVSSSGDPVSWADFARTIFKEANLDIKVSDTSTKEYFASKTGVAERPLQSTLDLTKIERTGFKPKDWQESLREYIRKELGK